MKQLTLDDCPPVVKLLVAGSRTFNDKEFAFRKLDNLVSRLTGGYSQRMIDVVSGCARGADAIGEEWSKLRGFGRILMPADWKTHGKAAGQIRNAEMVSIADCACFFWDGVSKGTQGAIKLAEAKGIPVRIFRFSR